MAVSHKILYLRSVFAIVEKLVHMEMSDQSKAVVENYLDSSSAAGFSEKAREAIYRYTEVKLIELNAIREKNESTNLQEMDHLVLKMEYASRALEQDLTG
ncbi:MAG: hypothetical protein HN368_24115 [Spirochaetales bacterium]|jgi:hypothetical protein|nr:hypothetical protein [Spirochaetales bacterium]